jgi:hypothetical protein
MAHPGRPGSSLSINRSSSQHLRLGFFFVSLASATSLEMRVSIKPSDLLDSEPQLRVYQIYPLGKIYVMFACPLVLTCSLICL